MFSENAIAILDKSDFLERFSSFIKRFQQFRNRADNSTFSSWIKEHNYQYIYHYLSLSSYDSYVPFSLTEFVSMSDEQLIYWRDYCLELKHLLDEKNELYETLKRYYK